MLNQLGLDHFSVLAHKIIDFCPHINIIVGENGAGKTHLLKILYASIAANYAAGPKAQTPPTKSNLQKTYADKLCGVFRPDSLGRLVTRTQGRNRCQVTLAFDDPTLNTSISFASNAKSEVQVDQLPTKWQPYPPSYLPTRELLTIYPGFVALYDSHYLSFDETWRDTCQLLAVPAQKGAREKRTTDLMDPIEKAMGGKIYLGHDGRFYLKAPGQGNLEINLVAEGIRKLAMLARLIATGSLNEHNYLFWDEPEANLNPKLVKVVAKALHGLAASGIQIFIGTHSFFLLKELEMLNKSFPQPAGLRFFGLNLGDQGEAKIQQAAQLHELKNLVLLDEELSQYERELALG